MTLTATDDALARSLAAMDDEARPAARAIAHAWDSGGGSLQPGTVAIRLLGKHQDKAFTAATIHLPTSKLELSRVILEHHGVPSEAFTHWADEIVDLDPAFDAAAKFPTLALAPDAHRLARLVNAMRDLARIIHD